MALIINVESRKTVGGYAEERKIEILFRVEMDTWVVGDWEQGGAVVDTVLPAATEVKESVRRRIEG